MLIIVKPIKRETNSAKDRYPDGICALLVVMVMKTDIINIISESLLSAFCPDALHEMEVGNISFGQ